MSDILDITRQLNRESLDAAGTGVAVWLRGRDIHTGSVDQRGRRVTRCGNLEFARLRPRAPGGKPILRTAYAVTAIKARTAAWVELTASLGGPGRRHELQFLLDGRELQDLRLGRETWSPKRLPLGLKEGRHVILVMARRRDELPDMSLEIREMDDRGGGRVYPVAPWAPETATPPVWGGVVRRIGSESVPKPFESIG